MASVDGLVSGLNTSDIIKQLMQLERQPQVRLQARQGTVESAISALQKLNTKFLTLTTAADKLTVGTGWALATATSSDETRVAATATAGAAQGTLSFNVKQLASAASYLSSTSYAGLSTQAVATDPATGAPYTSVTLQKGASAVTIQTGDGSLGALVEAINKAGADVTASAVQVAPGDYRLSLSSTTTGADTRITVKNPDGTDVAALNEVVPPRNAELVIGGTVLTRASNTISDALNGVTLTLRKADTQNADGTFVDPAVTVTVKSDAEGMAAQVAGLVDALNVASGDIRALTSYNLDSKSKGKLYGDSGIRGLRDRLTAAVVGDGTTSAGLAGVSVTRDGTVVFDKAKFLKALESDPAAVEAALGKDGLAGRVHALADAASRSKTSAEGPGTIAGAITARESQVRTIKSDISNWDNRLELKERTLQRKFAALEKALGASQQQGQWLAGQIAGLPRWGG